MQWKIAKKQKYAKRPEGPRSGQESPTPSAKQSSAIPRGNANPNLKAAKFPE
jgi:hypothetical protein